MNWLCHGALSVLERVYADDTGLFPFTNRLDGKDIRSEFDNPRTIRSTINCLLGLKVAARHWPGHAFLSRTWDMTRSFLRRHEDGVDDPGDIGLLAVLLAEHPGDPEPLHRALARLRAIAADDGRLARLNVQDLTWLLWGAVSVSGQGLADADPIADLLYSALTTRFVRPGDVLPRHVLGRGRGGFVSFGASAYYLRSTYAYGERYASEAALDRFDRGAAALLAAQGPQGEWPWLIGCRDGRPLDYYPVFSVHQHGMSRLFLFPAQQRNISGVSDATALSLAWLTGANQLGLPMVRRGPFFIYRSIERKAILPRAERFIRARRLLLSGGRGEPVGNDRVAVNTESRSYELGWLLYALSGSEDVAGVD